MDMISAIAAYLETNIAADLGVANYPTQADLPFRTVQQGDEQPISQYPALIIGTQVEEDMQRVEFGDGDPTTGIDRVYRFFLYGATPAASRDDARSAAQTLGKRLQAWLLTNDGLAGTNDGAGEVVQQSYPARLTTDSRGSGTNWIGEFEIQLNVETSI